MHLLTRIATFTGLTLAAASPGFAALSGFYDSGEQIAAIFTSAEIADGLSQQPVTGLQFRALTEEGHALWLVNAQGCDREVHLAPVPPEGPGKTTWQVKRIGECE